MVERWMGRGKGTQISTKNSAATTRIKLPPLLLSKKLFVVKLCVKTDEALSPRMKMSLRRNLSCRGEQW